MSFWIVQALTGMLIVFHWEIGDALVAGAHRPTDLGAIERRLDTLASTGSGRSIVSIWTSAGALDRWDVTVSDQGKLSETVRVDGGGAVLQRRVKGERWRDGGWIDTLVLLHQTLLGGEIGGWIVGVSGLVLLTNLSLALAVAWPRGGQWSRALRPPSRGGPVARFYGWHRSLGLIAVLPAMLLVATGTARVFADALDRLVGPPVAAVAPITPRGRGIGFARAGTIALERHPGARLAGVDFPGPTDAAWHIRLLTPGEPRRAYGATTLVIDGSDGRIIADADATRTPWRRWLIDLIYPLHTGEVAGTAGRLMVMALGAWLATMVVLGANLWLARRQVQRQRR